MFWYLKILADHEREELLSTSGENIEQLLNAEETLPAVVEAATQTRNTGKNVSVQFRSSRTAKGKFGFSTQCCVIDEWNLHHDNFPCISSTQRKNNSVQNIFTGCQTSIAQKSQETQCTLLKEFFTTSTPVQSDELSDNEDEMEQDDDPSYVPDPEEMLADADDNDTGFDDFDDCLYE